MPIQAALRLLDQAAAIQIARLIRQLALDHPLADAAVAGDRDRSELRHLAGLGVERDVGVLAGRAAEPFVDRHPGVREAVIAKLVERELLGGDDLLPIARQSCLERHRLLHRAEVFGRDDREAVEVHVRDPDGLAFRDRQRDVDRVLLAVQLHVERGDARVGVAAIRVEDRDAHQVVVEPAAIEVFLLAPREDRARLRRERFPELPLVHGLHAFERDLADLDGALLVAGCAGEQRCDETRPHPRTRHDPLHQPQTVPRQTPGNLCSRPRRDDSRVGFRDRTYASIRRPGFPGGKLRLS